MVSAAPGETAAGAPGSSDGHLGGGDGARGCGSDGEHVVAHLYVSQRRRGGARLDVGGGGGHVHGHGGALSIGQGEGGGPDGRDRPPSARVHTTLAEVPTASAGSADEHLGGGDRARGCGSDGEHVVAHLHVSQRRRGGARLDVGGGGGHVHGHGGALSIGQGEGGGPDGRDRPSGARVSTTLTEVSGARCRCCRRARARYSTGHCGPAHGEAERYRSRSQHFGSSMPGGAPTGRSTGLIYLIVDDAHPDSPLFCRMSSGLMRQWTSNLWRGW